MAPVRLRHPAGASTLEIPLEKETFTVQDLQQQIYSAAGILPSRQILKSGYPPIALTLIPELPLSSLGLKSGDQLIVNEIADGRSAAAPQPAPAVQPQKAAASSKAQAEHVKTDDGSFLIHRVVPDDNSCLFSSVALIFEQDISKAPKLRQIVADGIQENPDKFNEAILGMPPSQYVSTILKPSTWGGAIELGILASHYNTEIASIDVETGRIDHFSPGEGIQLEGGGQNRCLVIYSGIHYDAASLSPMLEAPNEWHQTVFPIKGTNESDSIIVAGKQLAAQLRAKRAFTNTSTFDLKCEECGAGLKGEKGARAHAEQTGHVRFGEY